jgi:hypothetical protein
MAGVNLQVRLAAELAAEIDRLSPGSRSGFVRSAVEEKIRRERARRLEQRWIQALAKKRDDAREADAWLRAEAWDEP